MNRVAAPAASGFAWWSATELVVFGITIPILPMIFALIALWVGREVSRNKNRAKDLREAIFINIGLVLVVFLVVTGKIIGTSPLEIGWATVWGLGLGMNGPVIFDIFQRYTRGVATFALRPPGDDQPRR